MKLWKGIQGDECDECGAKLNGKPYIHIGEQSHKFEHDTRQAMVCRGCIAKAEQKLKEG
jgi:hypothetical protein